MAGEKKSKQRKSKRSDGGEKRKKRSKRGKKRGGSKGGFYRVDANGNRCAGFAGSVSPLGNECFWAQRVPGIPREYRSLVPPMRAPGQFQLALDAANPLSGYTLRSQGVRGRDARRIAEIQALQGGANQYAEYALGRSLQRGKLGAFGAMALGGAADPLQLAMLGGRFDPVLYSLAQGGKIDPMMMYAMRGRR